MVKAFIGNVIEVVRVKCLVDPGYKVIQKFVEEGTRFLAGVDLQRIEL